MGEPIKKVEGIAHASAQHSDSIKEISTERLEDSLGRPRLSIDLSQAHPFDRANLITRLVHEEGASLATVSDDEVVIRFY